MNANSEPATGSVPAPKKSRLKRLLQNLALSCVTFLLCFVAAELALRLLGYGKVEIYQPDPALYWKLKPNQDCYTKVDHKPVHINAHGTRGPEFAAAKPPGVFRILCLGDSRTFGWGQSDDETYSARLREMLQARAGPAKKIEVINAGVNGWGYPQMLACLREMGLAWKPDVVIVGEANYWTQFSDKSSPEFVKKFLRRVWLKNLLRRSAIYHYVMEVQLQKVYEAYRMKFIPIDPATDSLFKEQQQKDPDAAFREAIETTCRLAMTNGIRPVLLYMPMVQNIENPETSPSYRCKRDIAARLGVPFVDMTPEAREAKTGIYLEADPSHFNVKGNELVGRRLFEAVSRMTVP